MHATTTGLRDWNPSRYGSLDLTVGGTILNDALSYDVFSQAAQAVRNPVGVAPLGGLVAKRVIATGHSQSGGRLIAFYNSVVPLRNVFDGFVMRGSTGSTAVRDDLGIKVFAIQSEADVVGLNGPVYRKPDSDVYRLWEVAGTSHSDWQGQEISRRPLLLRDLGIPVSHECVNEPARSRVPFFHVMAAALDHMVAWLRDGTPPPSGAGHLISLASTSPIVIARGGGPAYEACGRGLHSRSQSVAMLDIETGELQELQLRHESDEVERFYGTLEERALLAERLADLEQNPGAQSPRPEVKARLEQRRH